MFAYIWPLALVVISNIIYHVCAKSVPDNVSPFATLTVTYLIGALLSVIMFFAVEKNHNMVKEIGKMNWAPYVLGIVIVGLEVGYIYMYQAGWKVSIASIVQSSFLAIALIIVGSLLFKETLTWNKLVGIGICMVGLVFINWR